MVAACSSLQRRLHDTSLTRHVPFTCRQPAARKTLNFEQFDPSLAIGRSRVEHSGAIKQQAVSNVLVALTMLV